MDDYLLVNSKFEVLGRNSRLDYGNSEDHGVRYAQAPDIESAIRIAQAKWSVYGLHMMPYGVRMSEEAWFIYKRLLHVRRTLNLR